MADLAVMKKRALAQLKSMENRKESWRTHWADLRDYLMPRHGRNLLGENAEDSNRGDKKHNKIFDATHLRSVTNLAAGMHSGLTSPNRPWFKLGFGDPLVEDDDEVEQWLFDVETILYKTFAGSNIYKALHATYGELGVFGTAAVSVMEDLETIIRARAYTIGEYAMATDSVGRVNTFVHTIFFTAAQMRDEFGESVLPEEVKRAIRDGNEETTYTVYHMVAPAKQYPGIPGTFGKPYVSLWFEKKHLKAGGEFLKVAGYHENPTMTPRWTVVGDDIYGASAGMDVLADVKTAQSVAKTSLAMMHKAANPPMTAPGELRGTQINTMPGGVTHVDSMQNGRSGLAPLYQVAPDIQAADAKLDRLQRMIAEGLFADLFRMLQFATNGQMTATEVAERQQEKLLLLGPVLESVHGELLGPLIERTFGILSRNDMLPPAPEQIQDREIQITYISILAQAQKMAGVTAIEQLAGFVGNLASVDQGVVDNFDFDEAVREYGERLGVNPKMIKSREEVMANRQARAEAAAQQQQMEQAMAAAEGAKTLSQANTGENNALTALTQGLAG